MMEYKRTVCFKTHCLADLLNSGKARCDETGMTAYELLSAIRLDCTRMEDRLGERRIEVSELSMALKRLLLHLQETRNPENDHQVIKTVSLFAVRNNDNLKKTAEKLISEYGVKTR